MTKRSRESSSGNQPNKKRDTRTMKERHEQQIADLRARQLEMQKRHALKEIQAKRRREQREREKEQERQRKAEEKERQREEREAAMEEAKRAQEEMIDQIVDILINRDWVLKEGDCRKTTTDRFDKMPVYRKVNGMLEHHHNHLGTAIRDFARETDGAFLDLVIKRGRDIVDIFYHRAPHVVIEPLLFKTPKGVVDLRNGLEPVFNYALHVDEACGRQFDSEIPQNMDFDIPTLDKIMDDQDWTNGTRLIFFIMIGSLLYPNDQSKENWEAIPFILGAPGTGKSTIINNVVRPMFTPDTVIAFGIGDDKHALSQMLDPGKRLGLITETGKSGGLSRENKCQISSGDPMTVRPLYGDPAEVMPTIRLIESGNHVPTWKDANKHDQEAMGRRYVIFPMFKKPPFLDSQLGKKLREELPRIIRLTTYFYCKAAQLLEGRRIHEVLPKPMLDCTKASVLQDEDYLSLFIETTIEMVHDKKAPGARGVWLRTLEQRYTLFQQANNLPPKKPKRNEILDALADNGFKKTPLQTPPPGSGFGRTRIDPIIDMVKKDEEVVPVFLRWKDQLNNKNWVAPKLGGEIAKADGPASEAFQELFQ